MEVNVKSAQSTFAFPVESTVFELPGRGSTHVNIVKVNVVCLIILSELTADVN